MTNKLWGFSWEAGGQTVIAPDPMCEQVDQYICCPRGAFPGDALLYFRPDAAAALVIDQEVDIVCKVYQRDYGSSNQTIETITFKGYIPTHRSEPDARGYVAVKFLDKRQKLLRTVLKREFNTVFLMTWTAADEEYIQYNDPHVKADNIPYEWQEICDALFAAAGLPPVSLPVAPDEPMKNFDADGTVSECLERFLCCLGCSLVYDPFTGDMSIVLLSDSGDTTARETARGEGRLVQSNEIDISQKHGTAIVKPADWYPIRLVVDTSISLGAGPVEVEIEDWELADETTKDVRTARRSEIFTALDAWFRAESDLRDETFYGVIKQVPCEEVAKVTWILSTPDNAPKVHGHLTRIENFAMPVMWPKRYPYFYPPVLRGSTTASGLTITTIGRVLYWKSLPAGAFEETVYRVKAIGMVNNIDPLVDVLLWPPEHKWLAVRIC